ncbi:Transport protein particle subunit trs23 [Erysiphe necator]|nr:Transport protein particle subunit trs23 [Erysiphe necator]
MWVSSLVYALLIINKAGGLIYHRDFAEGLNKLSTNDYLVLAGTFHGFVSIPYTYLHKVHAITTRLNPLHNSHTQSLGPTERPEPPSGLEVLETENFRMQCFSTLTGIKFLLFTEPLQPNVDNIIIKIYELYVDYVMKNPFYQLDMPIRCEGWERRLVSSLRVLNNS